MIVAAGASLAATCDLQQQKVESSDREDHSTLGAVKLEARLFLFNIIFNALRREDILLRAVVVAFV
jgi:hypothetical protein